MNKLARQLVARKQVLLADASPADLEDAARHWAAQQGEFAEAMRHLVDEEQEYRIARRHEREAVSTSG